MTEKKKLTAKQIKRKEKLIKKKEFLNTLFIWKQQIFERDGNRCQKCELPIIKNRNKHAHHIIALQAVMRKYQNLLSNINNGILLCPYCHKFASHSPHQGGFEFTLWLEKNKPEQYNYLKKYLDGGLESL